ncbi:MAG: hypothetical protein RLY71_2610 [Pseudomonadota bacterium]|jgi:pimeloyl-ACP methyl ester carboxylesterase
MRKIFLTLLLTAGLHAVDARAANSTPLIEVRPNVRVVLHYMRHSPAEGSRGVVALLPGGGGGLALGNDSEPQNQNFLIRSRERFYQAGYDVVSIGNPSDHHDLAPTYRSSAEHVADLEAVVRYIRSRTPLPIWLVGTSRGTTSAAAAAARFGNQQLAGLVLSSSVSAGKQGGAVGDEDLASIKIPVLLVHHEKDGCKAAPLAGALNLLARFTAAPARRLIIEGGGDASGSECGPLHYHGYEGIEARTVQDMTTWMARPSSE